MTMNNKNVVREIMQATINLLEKSTFISLTCHSNHKCLIELCIDCVFCCPDHCMTYYQSLFFLSIDVSNEKRWR